MFTHTHLISTLQCTLYKCALVVREERENDIKVDLDTVIFLGCPLGLFKGLAEVHLCDALSHRADEDQKQKKEPLFL